MRQSDLPNLITLFRQFIHTYNSTNRDIQLLHYELFQHKKAHSIVRKLISHNGEANNAIQLVTNIMSDTEPTIKTTGREIVQCYDNYFRLVEGVTGANFPELIGKYKVLIEKCDNLNSEHHHMMLALREQVSVLSQNMEDSLEEIKNFIEGFPKVPDAICKVFLAARKDGKGIVQSLDLAGGYTHLNQSQSSMRDWLDLYEYQITNTKSQKIAFDSSYTEARVQLSNLDAELKTREILNQFTWRWAKTEIQQVIEYAQTKLQEQWRYWNMNEAQEWRTLYLPDATKFCNDVYEKTGSISDELKGNVARAAHEEAELAQRRKGLLRVINSRKKNKLSLSSKEAFAEKLCNSALWAGSKTEAKIALDIAQKIISKLASREDFRQAETIINNINTGGGAYIGGDMNMGENSTFVGRDHSSFKRNS